MIWHQIVKTGCTIFVHSALLKFEKSSDISCLKSLFRCTDQKNFGWFMSICRSHWTRISTSHRWWFVKVKRSRRSTVKRGRLARSKRHHISTVKRRRFETAKRSRISTAKRRQLTRSKRHRISTAKRRRKTNSFCEVASPSLWRRFAFD